MLERQGDQLPAQRHTLKTVVTYEVEVQQFNRIETTARGIGIAAATAFALIPTGITLSAALALTPVPPGRTAEAFWTLMWVCYFIGILCTVFAFLQRGDLKKCLDEIRESQVAPVAAMGGTNTPDLTPTEDPEATASLPISVQEAGEI